MGDGSTNNVVASNDASDNLGFGFGFGFGIAVGPGTIGNVMASNTARGNPFADLRAFRER